MILPVVSRMMVTALVCGSLAFQPRVPARAASIAGVAWLRVDPRTPATLYVGVTGPYLKRSTDGGATWQYLPNGTMPGLYALNCGDGADPPTIAQDSHDLYTVYFQSTDPVCRDSTSGLLRSRDGGLHFETIRPNVYVSLATPAVSRRVYAIFTTPTGNYLSEASCSEQVYSLDQGAASWKQRGTLPAGNGGNSLSHDTYCPDLIADPQQPMVLYANTAPPSRSEDGGMTWTTVTMPTVTPALADFALRYDPAAGGLLEGFTDDAGVPKDRVFLSSDHGRTWTAATCPGGHAGACPTIALQNVFGAGARYAVYPDGIYPFHGSGAAEARLSLGAGWPFTFKDVAAMQGGLRMGDPIYARLKNGALYRSADAGASWQPLAEASVLPSAKPASPPPGSLRAGPYGHAVGQQFVAFYRKMGPLIVGFPVDEPYMLSGVLTQDFEHVELQWRGGRVVVGELGREAAVYIPCGMGQSDNGPCPNGLSTNDATTPQTHAPDFARFVQQHGGAAIFGTPITRVYQDTNGDRSGRTYDMQLFTRARLEWHPENRNPTYRILLGLLGPEVLRDRQWL